MLQTETLTLTHKNRICMLECECIVAQNVLSYVMLHYKQWLFVLVSLSHVSQLHSAQRLITDYHNIRVSPKHNCMLPCNNVCY